MKFICLFDIVHWEKNYLDIKKFYLTQKNIFLMDSSILFIFKLKISWLKYLKYL